MTLLSAFADDGRDGHRPRLQVGEGLIGQCAAEKRRMLITDLPSHAVPIRSGLFQAVPRNVIVLPVLFEDQVKAVLELASLSAFTASHLAFLEQLTVSIGIVLNSIEATMQTEGLLKQSQQLATELRPRLEPLGLKPELVPRHNADEFGLQVPPEASFSPALSARIPSRSIRTTSRAITPIRPISKARRRAWSAALCRIPPSPTSGRAWPRSTRATRA